MEKVRIEKTDKSQKFVVCQPTINDKPINGVEYCFRAAINITGHSVLVQRVGFEIEREFGEVSFNTSPIGGGDLVVKEGKVYIHGASMTYAAVDKKILRGLEADIMSVTGADEVIYEDPDLPGGNLFTLYKQ